MQQYRVKGNMKDFLHFITTLLQGRLFSANYLLLFQLTFTAAVKCFVLL